MSDRTIERHSRTAARTGMINIRVKPAERALIDQAAAVQGKSRSDFMLEASRRAAEKTLLDQTLLRNRPLASFPLQVTKAAICRLAQVLLLLRCGRIVQI